MAELSADLSRQQQQHRRRLVIFVGPHKSASSTVQEFLVQYATGRPKYRKLKAFADWRWPVLRKSKIPFRKQWARLVYTSSLQNTDNNSLVDPAIRQKSSPKQLEELRKDLKESLQSLYKRGFYNVVVGSEELDRFGSTPWSHRDGIGAIHTLIDWAKTAPSSTSSSGDGALWVDLVVNYRTPRRAQWISIWKQLMSLEESLFHRPSLSYPNWICQSPQSDPENYAKLWEYLDCVANPLGLAKAIADSLQNKYNPSSSSSSPHKVYWKISLMDMGGVQKKGLDISHVSACDILKLPCNNAPGWVNGVNRTLVVNPKTRDLEGVRPTQLEEIEWVLQQRDCAYQHDLSLLSSSSSSSEPGAISATWQVLYPDSIWKNCPARSLDNERSLQAYTNTTYLIGLLQSQFGCQSWLDDTLNLTQIYQKMSQSSLPSTLEFGNESAYSHAAMTHPTDWMWVHALQWLLASLLFAGLYQFRRHRSRGKLPRRTR